MTQGNLPGRPKLPGRTLPAGRRRRRSLTAGWQTLLVTGLVVAASCGSGTSEHFELPPPPAEVAQVTAALVGKDGPQTIIAANTQVNKYAALAEDLQPGAKAVKVTGVAALGITAGDLILIMQMQGATIDFTDTVSFGAVTNYNGAGRYEFATVTGVTVASGTISISACNGGLRNAYSAAAHTQVVRVPQYTTLTVSVLGSVTAPLWNGSVGGVVAIHAQNALILNGKIDVTGAGFRPGLLDNATSTPAMGQRIYRSPLPALGGEKGEGIGGYSTDYDASGGRYGRGAPGNGGGGGNAHNGGGGGGANAANGRSWGRGQGVMDGTVVGGAAWSLDPGYIANGNKLTTDGGGGRGGYSFGDNNLDALTVGPNQASWGGDSRSEVGGLGGHPLESGVTQRLFFGGGGGAGDGNNNSANLGGAGGGLVFIATPTVTGTGSIVASGTAGGDTRNNQNDAAGGGGGGGTIVVAAQNLSGISATANGGNGGNQLIISNESEGPGAGGGGGFVAVSGGTILTGVAGGKSGTTQSAALTEFPSNGGTNGSPGNDKVSAQPLIPLIAALDCSPSSADLAVNVRNDLNGGPLIPGSSVHYTVSYQNLSATIPVRAASISDTIPPGIAPQTVAWTCAAQGGAVCPAAMGTGSVPPALVDLPAGSNLTYVVTVPVPMIISGAFNYVAAIQAPLDITDPSLGNNTATSVGKLPGPDLAVFVRDNLQGKNVQPGSPVVYAVTVSNFGALAVTGGSLTDTLPAGVTLATWTCTATGNAMCPAASGTGSLSTSNLNLPAGASLLYRVTTSAIPDNTLGALTYRLVVATPVGQSDTDPSNNQAVSSHAVDNSNIAATGADLGLKITHTPQKLFPGQDVTYTVQVGNGGPQAVSNTTVVFALPAGSIVKTPASGSGWMCTQAGTVASCVAMTLGAGDAPAIQVVITNPSAAVPGGAPVARGAVSAAKNLDPNPANDAASDLGSLPKADLALTIDRSPQTPQPGEQVTYTLVASNSGPDVAPSPSVVFTIPAGGTVTSPASGAGWACTQQDDTVTCFGQDLPMGSAPPITLQVKLPADPANGTPPLVGQVGSSGVEDPNLENNRAVSVLSTAPSTQADLAIVLSRDPASSQPGQIVTYTAVATNLGTDTVYAPTVGFQLPPGGVVVQPAQGSGWVCQQAGDTVTCARSVLAVGPAPPITVKLMTPIEPTGSAGSGTVAVAIAAVRNVDPNPANDHAVIDAAAGPRSNTDLAVTVSRDPQAPSAGQEQTITVLVTNKGPDAALGVAVSIQVPPDTQVVQAAQGSGWRCTPDGQTYLCTRDRLNLGDAPAITLKVITPAPSASGEAPQLGASVDAASAGDPTPADNSAQLGIGGDSGKLKLNGGGFSCAMGPVGSAVPAVQVACGALLAALLRRRRRR